MGGLVHGGNGTAIGIHRLENVQTSATLELQSGYALEGVTQALVFTGSYAEINDAALDLANSHLVLGGTGDAVSISRVLITVKRPFWMATRTGSPASVP
ncbi:hypothetical protein A8V49_16600 [Yersinia pestis]|nr:hypothetical protein A8V49_16600 [Yersinia pestis]